ncbi:zf-CCHC_4 domain-containing protein [Raphanus sativus]|nr:zf-CCHC_4 domain-containing protein [Raphanus sativus]
MRVYVNGLLPLIRKTTLEFDDGRELEVTLVYEKIQNHCTTCFSLCHDKDDCPENRVPTPAIPRSHNAIRPLDQNRDSSHPSVREPSNSINSRRQGDIRTPPLRFEKLLKGKLQNRICKTP